MDKITEVEDTMRKAMLDEVFQNVAALRNDARTPPEKVTTLAYALGAATVLAHHARGEQEMGALFDTLLDEIRRGGVQMHNTLRRTLASYRMLVRQQHKAPGDGDGE